MEAIRATLCNCRRILLGLNNSAGLSVHFETHFVLRLSIQHFVWQQFTLPTVLAQLIVTSFNDVYLVNCIKQRLNDRLIF